MRLRGYGVIGRGCGKAGGKVFVSWEVVRLSVTLFGDDCWLCRGRQGLPTSTNYATRPVCWQPTAGARLSALERWSDDLLRAKEEQVGGGGGVRNGCFAGFIRNLPDCLTVLSQLCVCPATRLPFFGLLCPSVLGVTASTTLLKTE